LAAPVGGSIRHLSQKSSRICPVASDDALFYPQISAHIRAIAADIGASIEARSLMQAAANPVAPSSSRRAADLAATNSRGAGQRRPKKSCARASNKLHRLDGVHGSSPQGRRFADIVMNLVEECGGLAVLNEAGRLQVRMAATLTLRVEAMQTDIVKGVPVNDEEFTRMSNSLNRTLAAIGKLRKASQPPSDDLAAVLASIRAEAAP
jgi:hypothetical protein